jgi:hypothetical protein
MKPKPQQMKAWKNKCTGVVDISQVKSRRPNTSMPNPKKNYQKQISKHPQLEIAKAKLIVPKPKAKQLIKLLT